MSNWIEKVLRNVMRVILFGNLSAILAKVCTSLRQKFGHHLSDGLVAVSMGNLPLLDCLNLAGT